MKKSIWWTLTAIYTAVIYLTLPAVPKIRDALGSEAVSIVTIVIFILFLIALIYWIIFRLKVRDPESYGWLIMIFVTILYAMLAMKYPSERIHLFQYSVLAFFVFKSLSKSMGSESIYPVSFATISIIGTLDELIQGILPNRYFGIHDIYLNIISGILGLLFIALVLKPCTKGMFRDYLKALLGIAIFIFAYFYQFESKHGNINSINVTLMMLALAMLASSAGGRIRLKSRAVNITLMTVSALALLYFGSVQGTEIFSLGYKRFFALLSPLWIFAVTLRNLLASYGRQQTHSCYAMT